MELRPPFPKARGERPAPGPDPEVSQLLRAWSEGDPKAVDELIPRIYDELHEMAERAMRAEYQGRTLQPTALIHEVYLRLAPSSNVRWQSRAHFFGSVARLMRQILVDHARGRQSEKRGGGVPPLCLDDALGLTVSPEVDLIALDVALEKLADLDTRQSRIVELRFFAGLTIEEVAELLGIGPATVKREWRTAKAWLFRRLHGG